MYKTISTLLLVTLLAVSLPKANAGGIITGKTMLLVPLLLAVPAALIGGGVWLINKAKAKPVAATPAPATK